MPNKTGKWTYTTESNCVELNGKKGSFTCVKAGPGNHGPVRVQDTYKLAYADGTPHFSVGTTCYAWAHQGDEMEEQTLKTLENAPFNKMRMCVFPKSYSYNKNEPEYYAYEGKPPKDWDLKRFGELPVVANGRVQPLDALARNAILTIHGKQRVPGEDPPSSPIEWLLELGAKPAVADERPIFLIHHDGVLGIAKLTQDEGKSFSYNQLEPSLMELSEESQRIGAEPAAAWSPYDKALMKLWRNIGLYLRLKHAFALPEQQQLESEMFLFLNGIDAAIADVSAKLH